MIHDPNNENLHNFCEDRKINGGTTIIRFCPTCNKDVMQYDVTDRGVKRTVLFETEYIHNTQGSETTESDQVFGVMGTTEN